jgi:hypothetical protein
MRVLATFIGTPLRNPATATRRRFPTRKIALKFIERSSNENSLDLILIFGVSVKECLDFEFVDPATQAASKLSLEPKVKAANCSAEEF